MGEQTLVEPEAKKKRPKKKGNEIVGFGESQEEEEDPNFDKFLSEFERQKKEAADNAATV